MLDSERKGKMTKTKGISIDLVSKLLLTTLLLAIGAVAICMAEVETPNGEMDFWRPDGETRDQLQKLKLPTDVWAATEEAALFNAYKAANFARCQTDSPEKFRAQEQNFQNLSKSFIEKYSPAAYLDLGRKLSLSFARLLEETVTKMNASDVPLPWSKAGSEHEKLRKIAGRFWEHAIGAGLIVQGQETDKDQVLVARLLWLAHWLTTGFPGPGPELMANEEKLVVLKWKVEASENLAMERRRQLIDEISKQEADYPALYVWAVLLARQGQSEEAKQLFLHCTKNGIEEKRALGWLSILGQSEM